MRSFEEIEEFALDQVDWFRQFLDLSNGVPFHDTMERVLSMLDAEDFERRFPHWAQGVVQQPLEALALSGCIVTIDAMGCQREIAKQIIEEKAADYVLGLKGNQGTLHSEVKAFFESAFEENDSQKLRHALTVDKGHGRIEERECWVGEDAFRRRKLNFAQISAAMRKIVLNLFAIPGRNKTSIPRKMAKPLYSRKFRAQVLFSGKTLKN